MIERIIDWSVRNKVLVLLLVVGGVWLVFFSRYLSVQSVRVTGTGLLSADDIRAAGGGVVVFGHVEGRVGDAPVRRQVVWTWKVRDGKAWSVRASDVGEAPAP